jgi:ABC-2 type transport system ATP-binding protein
METMALAILAVTAVFVLFRYRQRKQSEEFPPDLKSAPESTGLKSSAPLRISTLPTGTTTVAVSHVHKSFNGTHAVNDVSFEVRSGEILGIVGPNGAGKTTAIRMLMDIIGADSGQITILGASAGQDTRDTIGYLPEERGLYRKIAVAESLRYMAQLKGLLPEEAGKVRDQWLDRLGMSPHKGKKIEQLSKGMSQIIQLAATVIHDPELIILDEPFSGLDPVNREMLKTIILELKECGRTIILSTHQMNEVEALCDRVLMINKGSVVLHGELHEIRSRFRNNSVFLEYNGSIDNLPGVAEVKDHGSYVELFLNQDTSANQILSRLVERGVTIDRFEVSTPSLNEIFIKVAREES